MFPSWLAGQLVGGLLMVTFMIYGIFDFILLGRSAGMSEPLRFASYFILFPDVRVFPSLLSPSGECMGSSRRAAIAKKTVGNDCTRLYTVVHNCAQLYTVVQNQKCKSYQQVSNTIVLNISETPFVCYLFYIWIQFVVDKFDFVQPGTIVNNRVQSRTSVCNR